MSEKDRVQKLIDEGTKFAESMLIEHQEFHPFGWAMDSSGELISVAIDMGIDFPSAHDMIEAYFDKFRKESLEGLYVATAIFYDIRFVPPNSEIKSDAIAVALDDVNGFSRVVFNPYQLKGEELVFGDTFAFAGKNRVFKKPS